MAECSLSNSHTVSNSWKSNNRNQITTSRWVFTAQLRPTVRNAPELRSQHTAAVPVQLQYPIERRAAAAVPLLESPLEQTSKCISSVSFVRIKSKFFLQYTRDTDAKNDGPEFWNSNSVIFENFLKFSKRRRAAHLDHYGRGHIRSEQGPCDQVLSKSVNVEG